MKTPLLLEVDSKGRSPEIRPYTICSNVLIHITISCLEVIASSKDIKDKQKIEIIKTLTSSCGHQGMILGQQYDLDAEKDEYHDIKKIHLLKTAKLIQAAITLPYLGLYEYKDTYKILQKLGEKLGLAFQIMDDVLEISSNSETLGKNNNSDIKNSKMTYVSVFGLEESIQQAEKISNSCINEIKKKIWHKNLKMCLHFMFRIPFF